MLNALVFIEKLTKAFRKTKWRNSLREWNEPKSLTVFTLNWLSFCQLPISLIFRLLFPCFFYFVDMLIRLMHFGNFEPFCNSHRNYVYQLHVVFAKDHYFSRLIFDPSKWDLKFWYTDFNAGSCDYWKNSKFHEKSIKRDSEV